MRRGQGGRVPVPTLKEITEAAGEGREIVACAGVAYESMIVLKLACHNGDTATVLLGPHGRSVLSRALMALSPKDLQPRAARVTDSDLGPTVQLGYTSA